MYLRDVYAIALVIACSSMGCLRIDNVQCADGRLCPQGSRCDDAHNRCLSPDQLIQCDGQADGTACMLSSTPGTCTDGVCEVPYCGDGVKEVGEQCDGQDLGNATCMDAGFYDAPGLSCSDFCTFNVTACMGRCGDNVVDPGELCDGAPPANLNCLDFGFDVGNVSCAPNTCIPDPSACGRLGWTRVVMPTAQRLTSLWASGPRDVYTVGSAGTVVHFDGHAWGLINAGYGSDILTIGGSGPNDVFLGGYAGDLRHWDGTAWSSMNSVTGISSIHGIAGVAPDNVYAAAESGKISRYNGTAWSPVTTGVNWILQDIWARSASDIWTTGIDTSVSAFAGTLHFDGSTWAPVTTTATGSPMAITGLGSNVYILATNGAVTERVNGTWQQFNTSTSTTTDIGATARGDVFLSTYDHFVAAMPDQKTWSPVDGSLPILRTVGSDPAGHAWAAGDSGAMYEYRGAYWVTPGGSGTVPFMFALWGPDVTHVFGAGSNTCSLFNGGTVSILSQTCISNQFAYALWGSSPTDVYAAGTNGGMAHYAGSTWTTMSSGTSAELRGLWGSSASDVYAVGGGVPLLDHGAIVHWAGSSWTTVTLPTIETLNAIWGTDANHVLAVGNKGQLLTFDGTQWSPSTIAAGIDLFAIWGSAANDVWAVGRGGTILHYDGASWAKTASKTLLDLHSIAGTGPRDVFVGGDASTLLHYDGAEWSGVRVPAIENAISAIWTDGRNVIYSTGGARHMLVRSGFPSTACTATETTCADAVDDDCDFLVDCHDPDCTADPVCAP